MSSPVLFIFLHYEKFMGLPTPPPPPPPPIHQLVNTVDSRYNKLLGPSEITLLYPGCKTIKYKEILNFGVKKITLLYQCSLWEATVLSCDEECSYSQPCLSWILWDWWNSLVLRGQSKGILSIPLTLAIIWLTRVRLRQDWLYLISISYCFNFFKKSVDEN